MKRIASFLLALALAFSLTACTVPAEKADDGKIQIVATLFPYYDFARAIVGDRADVTLLLSPGREAHSFEPTPLDAVTISEADVFLYNGGEGEYWVESMLDAAGEHIAVASRMMDYVDALNEEYVEGMQGADGHDHDHEHGSHDDHDHDHEDEHDSDEIEYDEHIWTSPKNAVVLCRAVCDAICRADAENAAFYRANCENYCAQLEDLDARFAALCESVGRHGGVYTSHLRDQGDRLEESVQEAIDIARRSGARVNVSHHKAMGEKNFGKVRKTTRMLHEAGIPATHDVYPYAASSTMLIATLPKEFAKLEPKQLLEALADETQLERLAALLRESVGAADGDAAIACGLDKLLIANAPRMPEAAGKTIAQLAAARGVGAFEMYTALLRENKLGAQYIKFGMSEADVKYLMADELCMYGTDGLYIPGMTMTHPRAIGSFPRVLRVAVREDELVSLEEAVRKMTSMAAEVYGLAGKGVIRPGMDADLVLFDAQRITDHADYTAPLAPNEGIKRVYVNGVCAVKDDTPTGALAGRLLRLSR